MGAFCKNRHLDLTFKALAVMTPEKVLNLGSDIPPVKSFGPSSYAKCGFLWKLENPLLQPRKWVKKFCVLTREQLFIYKNEHSTGCEKSTKCLHLVKFVKCQQIETEHGAYFEFELFAENTRNPFRKSASIVFGTPDSSEAKDWTFRLQEALNKAHNLHYVLHQSIKGSFRRKSSVSVYSTTEAASDVKLVDSLSLHKNEVNTNKDLTYSYSSSEDEKSVCFGDQCAAEPLSLNESHMIRLTPRSLRSTKVRRNLAHLQNLEKPDDSYNEITTLPQENLIENPLSNSVSSLSCISEIVARGTADDDSRKVYGHPKMISNSWAKVTDKLGKSASKVEVNLKATKVEISAMQDTLGSLKSQAAMVENKLKELADHIKSTERQAKTLLNDLRIKSETLERKMADVDNLKQDYLMNQSCHYHYQTFPHKKRSSPKKVTLATTMCNVDPLPDK